ncbi:protein kinase [Rhodococcus erythropolis]|uniref:serine/threonine-protein kinase n=1 Tax=Rhodococcus erythropolis TaxID=1833 RepID=UPI001292A293|nr:serine/threonine-protein kinase [Rhodococcus erythropolis]MQP33998.1 protein kinase [Rhodococcus erythropolis]
MNSGQSSNLINLDLELSDAPIIVGGQCEIWKAYVPQLDRTLALKTPVNALDHAVMKDLSARFECELELLTDLSHPNIVRVIGTGEIRGNPCYIMNWADRTLRNLLDEDPEGMEWDSAKRLFLPIVDAMAYAHSKGVIHRDLKPENILIYGDTPCVSDFGLGRRVRATDQRLTYLNSDGGTNWYAAPEQFGAFEEAGKAADVYSLGMILAEMSSSNTPGSPATLNYIPPAIRSIVECCVQLDPQRRFEDAEEFARELKMVGYALVR